MSRPVLDAFYCFAFAVCRDPGKKHLQVTMYGLLGAGFSVLCCWTHFLNLHRWLLPQVDRAVGLWRVILRGRFRLLDRFCHFVESSPRLVINEDTWRQACRELNRARLVRVAFWWLLSYTNT